MKKQSGVALGTVLLCLVVLVVILFTASSASLFHLKFVNNYNQREQARNLAEAALSRAIEKLVESDYQLDGSHVDKTITVTPNNLNDAEGIVSFDTSGPLGGRYSVNNLKNDNQVSGAESIPVPGRTVHLLARGRVGNIERWMECFYHKPPFPDGLISTGPVQASQLQLVGVRRDSDYTGGDPSTLPPENVLPGNLFSNSSVGFSPGQPAVALDNVCDISGSVGSVGPITVSSSCTVGGEVLPGAESRPVPEINIRSRINAILPNAVTISGGGGDLNLDPNWFNKANTLNVGGDLILNGSAVVVQGDLDVAGAIKGTGIILVDGDVNIRAGGSTVETGEQVALACTGDLTLLANDAAGNYFKGLLYCEGDLVARRITVVGASVVHGKNGSSGSAILENVRYIYNPGAVSLSLRLPQGAQVLAKDKPLGSDPERHYAFSLTRRPNSTQDGFVYQFRLYVSNESDNIPNINIPLGWDDPANDPLYVEAFPDVAIPINEHMTVAQIAGLPEVQNAATLLASRAKHYCDLEDGGRDGEIENPGWAGTWGAPTNRLAQILHSDLHQLDATRELTFDLNNLFAESFGRSRILTWREYRSR